MRYLMTFSYDGTNFNGYQKQPKKRTVQNEIEKILSQIYNEKITISASGRTDSGVHAINQYAHFDGNKNINLDKLRNSMNKMLDNDIYIKCITEVNDDFHARFNVVKKEYIYKINIGEYNPIDRNYIYQYCHNLNVNKMKDASKYLEGEHNFKSLTKTTKEIDNYVRNIYTIDFDLDNNILTISFIGNGFLRYMVRNIVGLLISVGEEKIKPVQVKEILDAEDRTKSKKTAPSEGLYLYNVFYV